jgi:hypothetical protein
MEEDDVYDGDSLMNVRDELAADLDSIRVGGEQAAGLHEKVTRIGWRILLIPDIASHRRRLTVGYHYRPESLEAAIAYALALLLDDSRPFRKKLCRCDLSTCRRFFWAPPSMPGKGGKPLTTACTHEHKKLADAEKAVERVRRWRDDRRSKQK